MPRNSSSHVYIVAVLSLGLLVLMTTSDMSAADHADHRQHGAHVHGVAQMNLAVDGENVFLELASPAMNIVGFEHQPSTAAQRNAVLEAAARLEEGGSLFAFSKEAACTLVSASIDSALLDHGDDEYARGDSDEKHHDDEASDEKHHHAAAESHGAEEHSEFEASYQFTCASPKKLKALEVYLFTVFPGFEQIDTQILTASGQTGAKISAGINRLDL